MKRIFYWVFAPFMVLALLAWRLIPSARPAPRASTVRRFLVVVSALGLASTLAWRFYSHLEPPLPIGAPPAGIGLVVEDPIVEAPSTLRAGDLLLTWERSAYHGVTSGPLRSPFDFVHILLTEASRGGLRLSGMRGRDHLISDPGSLHPAPITRPNLADKELVTYIKGRQLLASGQRDAALSLWRDTARAWRQDGMRRQACWLFYLVAQQLVEDGQWNRAQVSYLEAISDAGRDDPHAVALIKLDLAQGFTRHGEFGSATTTYFEALAIRQAIDPDGLGVADVFFDLGSLAVRQGDLKQAEDWQARALALRKSAAPSSFEVVQSLGALAAIATARGDKAEAYDLYQQAVAVHRPLAPADRWLTDGLDLLGMAIPPDANLAPTTRLSELESQPALALQPDSKTRLPRRPYGFPTGPSPTRGPRDVTEPPRPGLE